MHSSNLDQDKTFAGLGGVGKNETSVIDGTFQFCIFFSIFLYFLLLT